jgi:uncharacterized protein with von Willebrand factor type A (vWA) domain
MADPIGYMSPEATEEFKSGMRKRELMQKDKVREAFKRMLGREPTEEDLMNPELSGKITGMISAQREADEGPLGRRREAELKAQYGANSKQYGDFMAMRRATRK